MLDRPRLLAVLVMLAAVSGCTVGPDYVKPEVETPDNWRYTFEDASGTVNAAWWEAFNDPVLDALINEALVNNKDVRIAAARVEEFAARVDITRAGFYPQIGYNADAARGSSTLDAAGVFAMVLECIPVGVAKVITETVSAVTIGCGAGPHVNGQNLNGYDILGLFEKFVPKFVKQYANAAPDFINAFDSFTEDVQSGTYPTLDHSFMGGDEISKLYPH